MFPVWKLKEIGADEEIIEEARKGFLEELESIPKEQHTMEILWPKINAILEDVSDFLEELKEEEEKEKLELEEEKSQ